MIALCTTLILILCLSVSGFSTFETSRPRRSCAPTPPNSLMNRATSSSDDATSIAENQEYSVEVSYEGRSTRISVRSDETLLSAMERSGAADRLSVPSLPSDCRRGNCLTCSGRHSPNSNHESLVRGEDGLSPHMSRQVKKAGYLLTCSSFVVGDGLSIELNQNNDVWNAMYQERIQDEMAQYIGRAAKARVIRRAAESNVPKWKRQTERVLANGDKMDQ